ncbi:YbdD/YjiX family protein [Microbacterium aurum]
MANSFDLHTDAADPAGSGPVRTRSKEFATRLGAHLTRAARGIRWYMTSLMGDSAYATYVAHQARHHPGAPVPTEREFWRQRMDDQDHNPGARCC